MPGFEDIFGSLFGGFTRGVHPLVQEVLLPWANKVGVAALSRWSGVVASGIRCSLPARPGAPQPCPGRAVAGCFICNGPVCLDHCMISYQADVICFKCVDTMANVTRERVGSTPRDQWQYRQGPPSSGHAPGAAPPPEDDKEREKALRTLGFDEDDEPTVDEVKAAFRELAKKHHPDKAPEAKKKSATAKFIKIQAAYDLLLKSAESRAA